VNEERLEGWNSNWKLTSKVIDPGRPKIVKIFFGETQGKGCVEKGMRQHNQRREDDEEVGRGLLIRGNGLIRIGAGRKKKHLWKMVLPSIGPGGTKKSSGGGGGETLKGITKGWPI